MPPGRAPERPTSPTSARQRARYPDPVTDPTPAPTATTPTHWTLTLVCDDRPGIVHAVSGAVVAAQGNITESQQFSSADTNTFFMRLQVMAPVDRESFEEALAPVVHRYDARVQLDVVGRPLRTLVLVSKAGHCLNDLLYRQRGGSSRSRCRSSCRTTPTCRSWRRSTPCRSSTVP